MFRAPVLSLNKQGGSGVHDAVILPIDPLLGIDMEFVHSSLNSSGIEQNTEIAQSILSLWKLFQDEHLVLAEINPLFVTSEGKAIAGDAKLIVDDAYSTERPFINLRGDIAVIASGGGASMLNIDILVREGGKPANYVEYSGNPPASLVEELTLRILSQPNLKGVWVIGGTANFTDIYETMSGFISGIKKLPFKPSYPIVIRRDGPRQKEAKVMLCEFAKNEQVNIEVYGPEMSMAQSAKRLVELMKKS
jgi:citryl-CoA synthetase large subunit